MSLTKYLLGAVAAAYVAFSPLDAEAIKSRPVTEGCCPEKKKAKATSPKKAPVKKATKKAVVRHSVPSMEYSERADVNDDGENTGQERINELYDRARGDSDRAYDLAEEDGVKMDALLQHRDEVVATRPLPRLQPEPAYTPDKEELPLPDKFGNSSDDLLAGIPGDEDESLDDLLDKAVTPDKTPREPYRTPHKVEHPVPNLHHGVRSGGDYDDEPADASARAPKEPVKREIPPLPEGVGLVDVEEDEEKTLEDEPSIDYSPGKTVPSTKPAVDDEDPLTQGEEDTVKKELSSQETLDKAVQEALSPKKTTEPAQPYEASTTRQAEKQPAPVNNRFSLEPRGRFILYGITPGISAGAAGCVNSSWGNLCVGGDAIYSGEQSDSRDASEPESTEVIGEGLSRTSSLDGRETTGNTLIADLSVRAMSPRFPDATNGHGVHLSAGLGLDAYIFRNRTSLDRTRVSQREVYGESVGDPQIVTDNPTGHKTTHTLIPSLRFKLCHDRSNTCAELGFGGDITEAYSVIDLGAIYRFK